MSRYALTERPEEPFHGDLVRETREASDRPNDFYCAVHGWITYEETSQPHLDFTREHNAKTGCLPTLETAAEAADHMRRLVGAGREWVAVFWDRGWGDAPLEILVIEEGDGQNPHAQLTEAAYDGLVDADLIRPSRLVTYKARKVHDFIEQVAS